MRQFTFGSYNLEEGGFDGGQGDRLRRQLEMLAAADADAWALQECVGWAADGGRYLHLAEEALGMRGFLATSNHSCDLAVFVRETPAVKVRWVKHETRTPFWHGVARVDADVDGRFSCRLLSVHLAPSAPSVRLAEAESLVLVAGPEKRIVLAGGDWNAVPAGDPDPALRDGCLPRERWKLDRSAAQAIEDSGLRDAAACLKDLTPTVGHASSLAFRCDRLYTSLPAAGITGYRVIAEDEPKSDHRPVVGVFDLDTAADGAPG